MVVRLSPNHGLPTARPAIIASRQDRDVASGKLHRMAGNRPSVIKSQGQTRNRPRTAPCSPSASWTVMEY